MSATKKSLAITINNPRRVFLNSTPFWYDTVLTPVIGGHHDTNYSWASQASKDFKSRSAQTPTTPMPSSAPTSPPPAPSRKRKNHWSTQPSRHVARHLHVVPEAQTNAPHNYWCECGKTGMCCINID